MKSNIRKTVMSAVLAAIITVATVIIQIPLPLSNGYINMGDTFIILGVYLLGMWAVPSAVIGSVIADLITGYTVFVPATFIIKGLMAFVAFAAYKALSGKKQHSVSAAIFSAVSAEAVMVTGYFLYSLILLDGNLYGAVAGVAGNAVQAAVAAVLSVIIMVSITKTKAIKMMK